MPICRLCEDPKAAAGRIGGHATDKLQSMVYFAADNAGQGLVGPRDGLAAVWSAHA
jgi:hypothetical protein